MFKNFKFLCLLLVFAMPVYATDYENFQIKQDAQNTLNSENIQSNVKLLKQSDNKIKVITKVTNTANENSNTSVNTNNVQKKKKGLVIKSLSDVTSSGEIPVIINTSGKDNDYIKLEYKSQLKDSISALVITPMFAVCDPYAIKINNVKYYMVINSQSGQYTLNNILGYGDMKNSLFQSLNKYDMDKNSKITKQELTKADIRFVAVIDGKLQVNDKSKDFDINKILYIDMQNTRESINNGQIGSFGYFDVYIKGEFNRTKKIIGFVTFDSEKELQEMLK